MDHALIFTIETHILKETVVHNDRQGWRLIQTIIIHGKFEGEALSWKGFDYAIVKYD